MKIGLSIMPEYDYACSKCSRAFSVYFSFKELAEKLAVICPQCQSDQVKKQIS